MSKFNYEILAGEDGTVVALNKKKFTKEQALELGKSQLLGVCSDWRDEKFIIFESHVHFGFGRDFDYNFINSWWIADLFEPAPKKNKNYVAVWVVRVEDEFDKLF